MAVNSYRNRWQRKSTNWARRGVVCAGASFGGKGDGGARVGRELARLIRERPTINETQKMGIGK
jgi:hypothetical protein